METEALVRRVAQLERSNRRLTVIAVIPSAVLAVSILSFTRPGKASHVITADEIVVKTIHAESIELKQVGTNSSNVARADFLGFTCKSGPAGGSEIACLDSNGLYVTTENYSAGLSTRSEGASLVLSGPASPGATEPATNVTLLWHGLTIPGNRQARLEMSTVATGSQVTITDMLNRPRAVIGSQSTTNDAGRTTDHPESTLSLWNETGHVDTWLPGRK